MSERDVKDIHVDREAEKNLFSRMLRGETEAHILLIQAKSGYGKSSLLREFREMSHSITTITIDLKSHHSSEGILFDCCFAIGQIYFNQFHSVCHKIAGTAASTSDGLSGPQRTELRGILSERFNLDNLVTLCFDLAFPYEEIPGESISRKAVEIILFAERNNRLPELLDWIQQQKPIDLSHMMSITGKPELTQLLSTQVKTKLASMDRDQRTAHRRMLTAAFFDDLQAMHSGRQQPFVFMFDTFNAEIIAEVKAWVDDFLKGARIYPWLIAVVAGQQFPVLSFDDRDTCYRHVLLPFNPQDVDEFARQANLSLEPGDLDLIYGGTEGVPLLLATILDNLRKRRATNE